MIPRRAVWVLLAILALAAVLRLFQLDAQSFWNDEGTSARVAERSLPLITAAAIGDIHPPLYYYTLHFWRSVFGESEFALRGLSAIFGVILVWLIYLLGVRLFDQSTALAGALVAAVNPFQIYYSQEARSYIMLAVWAAASTYFLFSVMPRQTTDRRPQTIMTSTGYVLTAAAGLYTHYAFPFVLVVHNLAILGWLIAQRIRPPISDLRSLISHFLHWAGLQVAVVVLYLPWLGIALRRLPEWQSPAPAYQLGPALLDTFRWFALGRTISTAPTLVALAAIGLFIIAALPARNASHETRRPFIFHPSSLLLLTWWLIPIALILAFGLYKEAYLKFLIVCSPAFCLLFARGIVTSWRAAGQFVPFKELGRGAGSPAQFWQTFILLLLVLVALSTVQSISNLYLDPAYARDNYRGIAQFVQSDARAGDAILLHAPNQWETFTYYHRDDSNVFPLARVRPVTEQAAAQELEQITSRAKRLFVLYWAETEPDPQRYIERWLDTHTFKGSETWYGAVRLAMYAVPAVPAADRPAQALDIRLGDAIQLKGYSTNGEDIAPGDILQLTLFWTADTPVAARYKVFIHVLGPGDKLLTQLDREPVGGLEPTSTWQPGQVVVDRYGIAIPANAAPGRYRIAVGLYGFDGVRLGASTGDQVVLTEITVP